MKSLLFIVLLLLFKNVFSCSCPELGVLSKKESEKYDVIFEGSVDSIRPCIGNSVAVISVTSLFKGQLADVLQKIYFDCSSSCMMNFQVGDKWLIYGKYKKYGQLFVELCGHSRPFIAKNDFNDALHRSTYEMQRQTLTSIYGFRVLSENSNKQDDIKRDLIKPKGYASMLMILVSAIAMLLIYYLLKRFL